jgi:hypothetical protein
MSVFLFWASRPQMAKPLPTLRQVRVSRKHCRAEDGFGTGAGHDDATKETKVTYGKTLVAIIYIKG